MPNISWPELLHPAGNPEPRPSRSRFSPLKEIQMADINSDERTVVERSTFNVANVILAIAVLLLVLGLLKYFHVSPL